MDVGHFSKRFGQTQIISVVIITGILVAVIGTSYMWGVPLIEKGRSNTDNQQAESFMVLLKQKIDDVAATGEQRTIDVDLKGTLELLDDNSINYKITTRGLNIASTAWVPLAGGSSPVQDDMAAVPTDGNTYRVALGESEICNMTATCPSSVHISDCDTDGIDITVGDGESFDFLGDTYSVDHIDCAVPSAIDGQALVVGPERARIGIVGIDEAGVVIAKSEPLGDKYATNYRLVYRELDDIETENRNGYKIYLKREGNNVIGSGSHKITIRRAENPVIDGTSQFGGDLFVTEVYIIMS